LFVGLLLLLLLGT